MSRCFPYPPPKYDLAEIESIKLLREEEKTKKEKERKERKEKRREKAGHESSKHSKHSHKRKYDEAAAGLADHKDEGHKSKKAKETVEQFEKSGLSEEHGLPCSVPICDSPERSHDSGKKRCFGTTPSPSQSNNSGSTIRIRLPVAQPRELERLAPMVKPSISEQQKQVFSAAVKPGIHEKQKKVLRQPVQPEQKLVSATAVKSRTHEQQKQVLREVERPAPLVRTGIHEQQKLLPATAVKSRIYEQQKQTPPAMTAKQRDLKEPSGIIRKTDLKQTLAIVGQRESIKPKPIIATDLPIVSKQEKKPAVSVRIDEPAGQISRPTDPTKHLPNSRVVESSSQPATQREAVKPKPRDSAADLSIARLANKQVVVAVTDDEPCFSGRKAETKLEKESSRSSHKQHKRKSRRKEAGNLFEELIANWNPPVILLGEETDTGDQDWLFSSRSKAGGAREGSLRDDGTDQLFGTVRMKCSSVEDLVGHASCMVPSLQPMAVYMPDFNVYQLPYVVPF